MLFYIIYVMAVSINFCGCVWCFVAHVEDFDPSWVNFYPPFVVAYGVAAADRPCARASLHCLPPPPRTPDRPLLVLNPPSRVQPPAANTRVL
jgi:hypothetical protein